MNDEKRSSPFDDFLNPKSMLTPGIAGALAMAITNALTSQFGLWPNYTALIVSFVFGLLVFRSGINARLFERGIYYVLNSLIIFSVAVGTNQAGVTATHQGESIVDVETVKTGTRQSPFFVNWLDDTVPRREALVLNSQNLSEQEAQKILTVLVPDLPANFGEYRKGLGTAFSTAQTGEDVQYMVAVAHDKAGARWMQ